MSKTLSTAEINHLRLLLGWVRCEVGQDQEEMLQTVKRIAPAIEHELSKESQQRLVAAYEKSGKVPKYVRRAIKKLERVVIESQGEVVDAQVNCNKTYPAPQNRPGIIDYHYLVAKKVGDADDGEMWPGSMSDPW